MRASPCNFPIKSWPFKFWGQSHWFSYVIKKWGDNPGQSISSRLVPIFSTQNYFYTSSKLPTTYITDSLILRILSEKKRIAKLFWFIIVFIDIVNLWPQKIGSCYNEFLVHHRMYLYVCWYMYDDDQSKLERRFKMHSSTSLIYP